VRTVGYDLCAAVHDESAEQGRVCSDDHAVCDCTIAICRSCGGAGDQALCCTVSGVYSPKWFPRGGGLVPVLRLRLPVPGFDSLPLCKIEKRLPQGIVSAVSFTAWDFDSIRKNRHGSRLACCCWAFGPSEPMLVIQPTSLDQRAIQVTCEGSHTVSGVSSSAVAIVEFRNQICVA